MTTFPDVLSRLLRSDSARPLLTWYDETSGERVELSVATYANWVAKTASLLVEEHDLERGQTLRVDLPAHWLHAVFLGAAWNAGLVVSDAAEPDAVICGPAELERWADQAGDRPVLACSLLPLGVRFAEPLPPGVYDVGADVWSQPDSFIPLDPPQPDDPAVDLDGARTSQSQLWGAAAVGTSLTDGGRLLVAAAPASPPGIATLTEPLARGGSLVWVSGATPERLPAIADAERVTHRG